MKFDEEILNDQKILCIRLHGNLEQGSMDEFVIYSRKKAYDLGFRLIIDFTDSNNMISISEALRISKMLEKPEYKRLKDVRVCFVTTGSFYVFAKVVEQFMFNAESHLKVFKNMEGAMQWFKNSSVTKN